MICLGHSALGYTQTTVGKELLLFWGANQDQLQNAGKI